MGEEQKMKEMILIIMSWLRKQFSEGKPSLRTGLRKLWVKLIVIEREGNSGPLHS